MGRLFGTDGVRGLANADLTPELALRLAASAAHILSERDRTHPPVALVGRDPRASGEMLEAAVVAGLTSAGATVVRVGVLPTPGVAYLVGQTRADLGVMISASHNPMPDNGIKFFAAGGHKLPDELEDAIEAHLSAEWVRPQGTDIGRVHDLLDGAEAYIMHLVGSVSDATRHVDLAGLKVVVDCANGAAFEVAPEVYRRAGAEVITIHDEPDGVNINDNCGSTHLEDLRAAVIEHSADLGVGLDGDADRCLAVDATGAVVDGDQLMAIMAVAMREAGTLVKDTLVTTVMSNLGLRIAMAERGITVVETKVGDRYVLEELRAKGLSLGGEQSGHVVMPGYATTGDGTLTALQVMGRMVTTGQSLAGLASIVRRLPQVLVNVAVADKRAAAASEAVAVAVADAEAQLAGAGRVLLRPSGTEQLVRVMVEAASEELAGVVADRIAQLVRIASPI